MEEHKAFVRALAPPGNLFLLITLQELRRQGLTYLAFYMLQRVVHKGAFEENWLLGETGRPIMKSVELVDCWQRAISL